MYDWIFELKEGSKLKIDDYLYVLASVGKDAYVLVGWDFGTRWNDPMSLVELQSQLILEIREGESRFEWVSPVTPSLPSNSGFQPDRGDYPKAQASLLPHQTRLLLQLIHNRQSHLTELYQQLEKHALFEQDERFLDRTFQTELTQLHQLSTLLEAGLKDSFNGSTEYLNDWKDLV